MGNNLQPQASAAGTDPSWERERQAAASGPFDPSKSSIGVTTMDDWLASPVQDDITQVPGVGEANEKLFKKQGVLTTYQLLATFLALRTPGMLSAEHCNAFYATLVKFGINAKRNEITMAVAMKCNSMYPGIYKADLYVPW